MNPRLLPLLLPTLLLPLACATQRASMEDDPELQRPAPPTRVAHDATARASLRDVPFRPTGSDCVLACRVTDASGVEASYELERSADSLVLRSGGAEWFFERNPVVSEELTGYRVERDARTLVEYPYTDLTIDGVASDWSSLARVGLEPATLAALQRTGRWSEAFGLRFEDLRGAPGSAWREVSWSDEHQIPLRAVRADGATIELVSLELRDDPVGSRTAPEAYPGFEVRDVADWREHLHDHAPTASSQGETAVH